MTSFSSEMTNPNLMGNKGNAFPSLLGKMWKLTHNNSFQGNQTAFRWCWWVLWGSEWAASPNPYEEWGCQISLTACASFNGNITFMHINTMKYKGLENRLNFQPLILTYCTLIPESTCQLLVSCRWYWECKFECSAVAQVAFQIPNLSAKSSKSWVGSKQKSTVKPFIPEYQFEIYPDTFSTESQKIVFLPSKEMRPACILVTPKPLQNWCLWIAQHWCTCGLKSSSYSQDWAGVLAGAYSSSFDLGS